MIILPYSENKYLQLWLAISVRAKERAYNTCVA
jgi:hypothetical protein